MTATEQESLPALTSHAHPIASDAIGYMRDSTDALGNIELLRERMNREGYLYLPGLLNKEWVLDARRSITSKLAAEGNLDPNFPVMDAVAQPDKPLAFRPDLTVRDAAIIRLLYSGELLEFYTRFLNGEVPHFDYTWLRAVGPGRATTSHCDIVYMGRGTHNLYTTWTPLGDVPFEQGGLMVLENSNNNQRLRSTYCTMDVDSFCTNREGRLAKDFWGMNRGGGLSRNPNQIRKGVGGTWRTADYKCGDVVLFTMFTVHCSGDNHSNRVRLSTDSRYQLASEPVDERWIGEKPIAHGQAGKRGRIC
jgi:hypothetical protein